MRDVRPRDRVEQRLDGGALERQRSRVAIGEPLAHPASTSARWTARTARSCALEPATACA